MRKIFALVLLFSTCFAFAQNSGQNSNNADKSIVIIYENDVHCAVDGYQKMAGFRDAISLDTAYVLTTCSGDFIQGATAGSVTRGQAPIDIMKSMHYDAVTLGNHEFDFGIPQMQHLLSQLDGNVVCANLTDLRNDESVFAPYIIKNVGNHKIAFIGFSTPTTLESNSYVFCDSNDNIVYSMYSTGFYEHAQKVIDEVRAFGADYVIVLSHLGEGYNDLHIDSHSLIQETTGIDAILDAHTHSVVPQLFINDKEGKPVLITQTGTRFANVGKLLISRDGKFSSRLFPVANIHAVSQSVKQTTDSVQNAFKAITDEYIGQSKTPLRLNDRNGNLISRISEVNSGDLGADAQRIIANAQIGIINGGSLRNELPAGDLTYGDILTLMPYENYLCKILVKGSNLKNLLLQGLSHLPASYGSFLQVSGIKMVYYVNKKLLFVKVLNADGSYSTLDPDKEYVVATTDYILKSSDTKQALGDFQYIDKNIMNYSEATAKYIRENLNGFIGKKYYRPQGRIIIK